MQPDRRAESAGVRADELVIDRELGRRALLRALRIRYPGAEIIVRDELAAEQPREDEHCDQGDDA